MVNGRSSEISQLAVLRHAFSCYTSIEQSKTVKNRIMQKLFHMGKAIQIVGEVFRPRHPLLPSYQFLTHLRQDEVRCYVAPERTVIPFADVMQIDEVAKVVNLLGDGRIVALLIFLQGSADLQQVAAAKQ